MNGPSEFHVVGSLKTWDITDRLHEIEHRLLPRAVRLFCAGLIEVDGRVVRVREERLA